MWNVLVNIYFIISGVLFVALLYKSYVSTKRVKEKFGDRLKATQGENTLFTYVAAFIKTVIISFIPLFNLLLLYLLIFHEREVDDGVDANVEARIKELERKGKL